jgi:hypothetical protein
MSLIRAIYRTVLSEGLRLKIYRRKSVKKEKKLLGAVIGFLRSPANPFPKPETDQILGFLESEGLHVFPYAFTKKYRSENIQVHHDEARELNYVMHSGRKLYFKRNWDAEMIKEKYSFLLNEQDPESPHQYLSRDFSVDNGSVVVDAGAAEGIFILPLIDKIKHAYLFETEEEWIEALNATFSDYRDKITIVNKYVSNIDDSMNVKLDSYFKNGPEIDFIKIDVDGAERDLLDGSKKILSGKGPLKVAICTYHNQEDESAFDKFLRDLQFHTETSPHYMLFHYDDNFKEPYLRRGIIRAKK